MTITSSWICTGAATKPHDEIENWGQSCSFPGCSMVHGSDGKATLPATRSLPKIPNFPIAATMVGILAIGVPALLLISKFRSTPPPPPVCTSPPCPTPPPPPPPEWISCGDRALNKSQSNPFRDRGIEAFKTGNFSEAITQFEKGVAGNRNDPEVQIYLNNAKARIKGSPLRVAAVVPVDNRLTAAQAMLRGIADAQTRFNDAGGVDGKLVEITIGNDGNEADKAKSIAQHLANNPDILGVIGHNSSTASQAALVEYEKAGLAMIAPTSTSDYLSGNVFLRTVPSDGAAVSKLSDYAKNKLQIQKVAVFYDPNSAFSKNYFEVFEKNFKALGGEVFTAIDLSKKDLDAKQEIQALRDKVTAIVLFPDPNNIPMAISIFQANAQVPGPKFQLLGGNSLYGPDTLSSGGNSIEGLVIPVSWVTNNQPYAQAAYQRWGGTVNWRTASSFDATIALLKALSSKSNRSDVLKNLKASNIAASETSGQEIRFTPQGERQQESVLVQVTKGGPRPEGTDYGFQPIQPTPQ